MTTDTWRDRGPKNTPVWQAQAAFVMDHDGPAPAVIIRSNDPLQPLPFEDVEEWSNTGHNESDESSARHDAMTHQDRYIDSRLAAIEGKLDARLDAMQRFQDQAENRNSELIERIERQSDKAESRFKRATERHETDLALARQQINQEFSDARKHATTTAWATVAGVFAGFAIIAALVGYWVSEQGSYAKSYGEAQVEMERASDERAEFREAVKSIQGTQKSILERLPPPQSPRE